MHYNRVERTQATTHGIPCARYKTHGIRNKNFTLRTEFLWTHITVVTVKNTTFPQNNIKDKTSVPRLYLGTGFIPCIFLLIFQAVEQNGTVLLHIRKTPAAAA